MVLSSVLSQREIEPTNPVKENNNNNVVIPKLSIQIFILKNFSNRFIFLRNYATDK
jgi:hypothetical protein